jgi:hypothetical protein
MSKNALFPTLSGLPFTTVKGQCATFAGNTPVVEAYGSARKNFLETFGYRIPRVM